MAPAPKRFLRSGDHIADRRADYAVMLGESGDPAAAAELMEQALELSPDWAAGWFQLGEYRETAKLIQLAVLAYHRTIALAPDDIFGAGLKLALLGDTEKPDLPPSRYVEGLFDDYAEKFDAALVERLGYTVPGQLMALIETNAAGPYGLVIDLGCGTGLFGAEIHGRCDSLEGYDLSENMLAKARAKDLYQHLAKVDLSLPPARSGLFESGEGRRADLVAAADVMIYLGDLDAAFANTAALLKPSGIFAFSAERATTDTGFELLPSMRYAHSADHVKRALAAHGMQAFAMQETAIRIDAGAPIMGLLFLARTIGSTSYP